MRWPMMLPPAAVPGPAGLGEALAARAAEIARHAVVRAVVALLAALDGPVAAPRRSERLVDRLRDSLRRRHRRVGHAGGQRITAPDIRARQAGAGLRNLESCLGDRLRSGVDARGIQGPERARGLVEGRLTLRGVLHDLLEDPRSCLADRLDALGLRLVAIQVGVADDDRGVATHRIVDDRLDRRLGVHAVVVAQDGIPGETLLRDRGGGLCLRLRVLALRIEEGVTDVVARAGGRQQLVLSLVALVVQLEARLRYATQTFRDCAATSDRRLAIGAGWASERERRGAERDSHCHACPPRVQPLFAH